MNVASQVAAFREQGFTTEQAEVLVLMRVATAVLFQAFPESFLLFGGATLLFFHQSVRHSADIDLLLRAEQELTSEAIRTSLEGGLAPTAEALNVGPLQFEDVSTKGQNTLTVKLWIMGRDGRKLFRVDLSRFGSVLESEVEEHTLAIGDKEFAKIKSASRDFLFLQKAECFLLRKVIQVRDAFDIHLLKKAGTQLDDSLKRHLGDTLLNYEIEPSDIEKRIGQVEDKRCRSELQPILPAAIFDPLAKDGFKPLRDVLHELYADWLER